MHCYSRDGFARVSDFVISVGCCNDKRETTYVPNHERSKQHLRQHSRSTYPIESLIKAGA